MPTEEDQIRKRVWVQNVAVQASVLEAKLAAIGAREQLTSEERVLAAGTLKLVHQARDAAFRDNPIPGRWAIWWRGTLIEAAYQNLHAAQAMIVGLYDAKETNAEIPDAVARVEASLNRDDPRRARALALLTLPTDADQTFVRERLRKTIEVGYGQVDQLHSRLRSFRNLVLAAAAAITAFMAAFMVVVWLRPTWVPLCFQPASGRVVCPTGAGAASGSDVLIVALLGLLGGTLAGAVSIRRLHGTSAPYDVPTALALLKAPFGAMTAIGALIAIRGDFIPGLSALDSQAQILAYAFVFGYGQQLLTGQIDRQARAVLRSVPSKGRTGARTELLHSPSSPTTPAVV